MKDATRKGVIGGVIVVILAAYFFIWTDQPIDLEGGDYSMAYLDSVPVTPDQNVMIVGSKAPDFSYTTIKGTEITLSDYIGSKPVVLDFWATWCGPCLRELPDLQALYETHSDELEIIAISAENERAASDVIEKIIESTVQFPVIHDPSGAIEGNYPHTGLPYVVLIDVDGNVIETHSGYSESLVDTIKEAFDI